MSIVPIKPRQPGCNQHFGTSASAARGAKIVRPAAKRERRETQSRITGRS